MLYKATSNLTIQDKDGKEIINGNARYATEENGGGLITVDYRDACHGVFGDINMRNKLEEEAKVQLKNSTGTFFWTYNTDHMIVHVYSKTGIKLLMHLLDKFN